MKQFELVLTAPFSSEKDAETAAKSIDREMGFKDRSAGTASAKGAVVEVRLSAPDLVSLRASANAALRLLKVAGDSLEAAKKGMQ